MANYPLKASPWPVLRAMLFVGSGIVNVGWSLIVFFGEVDLPGHELQLPILSALLGVITIGFAVRSVRTSHGA